MADKYSQISSEIILKNPYWVYKKDEYILPDGDKGNYYYVETPGSVFIIPRSVNNKYIMVNQFRYLNQSESIEFPGGGAKADLSMERNALTELEEEAGYTTKNLVFIGKFNPFNGVTSEICNVFLASDLAPVNSNPDKSEEFEIIELTAGEIDSKIGDGTIWDGMTLAAWSIYRCSKFYKD